MAERGMKFLFQPGEHVLCFEPDPAKARVLYEAKVLETSVVRDRRGRKKTGYQIHFQGWNSSWDRIVPENFVLKNSDDNRQLMKRLVHTARHIRKNKARRRRIDEILRIHFNNTLSFVDDKDISTLSPDSDIDDDDSEEMDRRWQDGSDEATEDYDCDTTGHEDEGSDEDEADTAVDVDISLPENLRKQLEEDWMLIKQRDKMVRLPASLSVIQILEGYVKHIAVNSLCATGQKIQRQTATPGGRDEQDASKTIDLSKEVADGIRTAFDFCLPSILLYDSERAQFETETQSISCRPPAKHNASCFSDASTPGVTARSPRHRNASGGHQVAASTHNTDEPPSKLLHIKQEMVDQSVDEPPTRRITRHLLAVEARKMKKKSSKSSGVEGKGTNECKGVDRVEEVVESSAGEETSTTPMLRRNSLRSRMRHSSGTTLKALADCVSPAPPAATSGNCPAATVEHRPSAAAAVDVCTPKKQPDQTTISQHDALVNEVLSWQLIPPEVYSSIPPPPSTIYGAHHLLRLFVKLPDLLQQMALPRMHLQQLTQHLEMFLGYLSERIDDLFPVSAYIDHQEFNIHSGLKIQATKHVGRTI
ncbi:hypothetical protein NP493_341g02036 [Ridgeia piscesae]|uniref:MRG domain-containing protein n=1 Tax=Ridgeia piscesae TaxID=27915 RepID=A0AAD9L3Z7_RIDPI|nr:hypothetical protein NP493_341g02036 [Ridgeia piscesae]